MEQRVDMSSVVRNCDAGRANITIRIRNEQPVDLFVSPLLVIFFDHFTEAVRTTVSN